MKIVIYANSFFPNIGGGERYNMDLANSLKTFGYDVVVITPVQNSSKDCFKFPVIRIPKEKIMSIWKISKILKQIAPDILHISGPTEIDFILPALAKLMNISVIMTYHADFPSRLGRLYNSMMGLLQFSIDKIIVQTRSDMNKLLRRRLSKERIAIFPFNGIDQTVYRNLEEGNERYIDIVFVGRMDKEHSYKGYWNLLKILFKMTQNCGNKPMVYVIGGGAEFEPFREESANIGVDIQYMEDVAEEELIRVLNKSKYIILPSTSNSEGFGRIVLEAIYCGVIPIVSKYAGSHELISERSCGHIIDPLDVEGTSALICKLIQNYHRESPELSSLQYMIKNEEYSLTWTISKTLELYSEILQKKGIR